MKLIRDWAVPAPRGFLLFPHPLLLLLLTLLLAACAAAPSSANTGGPTVPPSTGDAESVARSFLDAWVAGNYEAMYALLSPRSLVTSREAFTQAYRTAEATMRLASDTPKRYELLTDKTVRQGSTTVVTYNMTFNSIALGQFADSNRMMRLILAPSGWRVAWSTMDIFEGMAGGATLQMQRAPARRGTIYDRNNKVIAQDATPNYAVRLLTRAYPTGRPDECLDKLAQVFRLYRPDLDKYKAFTGLDQGYTVGTLSEPDYQVLKPSLDAVCLLEYQRQVSRFYYGGNIAAQTVGFVGSMQPDQVALYPDLPQDAMVGQYGVERFWQKELAGTAGAALVIQTTDGVTVRTIYSKDAIPGQDVSLTLDRAFQLRVEEALTDAYSSSNWGTLTLKPGIVKGAAVVVLDVKTGQVLAMASYPSVNPDAWRLNTSFDVGTITDYSRKRAMVNRATEETHPLGSVMKIASMAAAAGSGAFRLDETVDCKGTYKSPDENFTRTDWIYLETWRDKNYHGIINLKQALTASCDVYFWTVGARLNAKDATLIRQYANRLGLGVRTGIDALTEQVGAIPDPDWARARGGTWGIGDSLNIVIGQGDVQVTALQVARMMVGIANGKNLWKPYLVRSVGYPGQPATYAAPPPQADDIGLSKEVVQGIQDSLCQVTSNKDIGTAQWVFWDFDETRIRVCGKTGTAQSGQANPHGWFAAYAGPPGQPPEIAVVGLTLYSREGSETSAPIVRRVIEAYYGIPYEPWPDFWSKPYEQLPTPGLGEGGPPPKQQ